MWGWFTRSASDTTHAREPAADAPPQSYAQWSHCLDALAQGDNDEACLQQLKAGTLEWTGGVAPMFAKRVSEEIQRRLQQCSERLSRDLQRGAQESLIVRAVLQARAQLGFVHQLCQLPVLPASTQQHLLDEIRRFAERSQQSLEDTAKADRSGQLATLLRNNPLTRYANSAIDAASAGSIRAPDDPGTSASPTPGIPGRKRNILN